MPYSWRSASAVTAAALRTRRPHRCDSDRWRHGRRYRHCDRRQAPDRPRVWARRRGTGSAGVDAAGVGVDGQRDGPGETRWQDEASGNSSPRSPRSSRASSSPAKHDSGAGSGKPRSVRTRSDGGKKSVGRKRSRRATPSGSSTCAKRGPAAPGRGSAGADLARARRRVAGLAEIDGNRLDQWEQWASDEANRLDPIVSGQVMTHLEPVEDAGSARYKARVSYSPWG